MILRVIDDDEFITVINVMVFQYLTGETTITVWDYADNVAEVVAKQFMDAVICAENLYTKKEATIYADIDWLSNE